MSTHRHRRLSLAIVGSIALTCPYPAWAQNALRDIPPPDPSVEQQSFTVADEFEVNLFAADPRVRKPVQMAFDARGRLWVTSPTMYPQILPGQEENDRIVVLEDENADGRADRINVFAEGLMMPTGILPGDGGVYVAHGNELIHLADTSGDGVADRKRVILRGFGTEDTHHVIHALRWGPDGRLYFNQSYYISSHVETPYGVRRMNGGGIWRYDTQTGRLEAFIHGLVNSWGHRFDRWGQSFATDGAGGEGINFIFPGAAFLASPHATRILHGLNPGSPKLAGLEILHGRSIPESWQGRLITADFRANRINSFELSDAGSGYASRKREDLIHSTHVAFRPVELVLGPDGAVYIADWYSPIIQHGEVNFKDPRRDRIHGRIWRLAAKGKPVRPRPRILDLPLAERLELFRAPEQWTREQVRRSLYDWARTDPRGVLTALDAWVEKLDPKAPGDAPLRLEALWVYQTLRVVRPDLLRSLLQARDPRVRAASVRVLGDWRSRLDRPLGLLADAVVDEHPRVRLEAVVALARIPTAQAAVTALNALDRPMDRFLDYALWRTCRTLQPHWLPALEAGTVALGNQGSHLVFALQAADTPAVVGRLLPILRAGEGDPSQLRTTGQVIAALGNPEELRSVWEMALDAHRTNATRCAALVSILVEAATNRAVRPTGSLSGLATLLKSKGGLHTHALRLVGLWKEPGLRTHLVAAARLPDQSAETRAAALEGLARLGQAQDRTVLLELTNAGHDVRLRVAAVGHLAKLDVNRAARAAVDLLETTATEHDLTDLFAAFITRKRGPRALEKALAGKRIPTQHATAGIRAARLTAVDHNELIATLRQVGGVEQTPWTFTRAELDAFIRQVHSSGRPDRGEDVYRRASLTCLKCHAIAGAGGRVGPDLASVGASAPVDYLVESLVEPAKQIKENYASLILQTNDGRVLSGIRVHQTADEVRIRTADDTEIVVPASAIEAQATGGSLMPSGLVDALSRTELVDLVSFLSRLGKLGPYAVGPERVVRSWQVQPFASTPSESTIEERIRLSQADAWTPIYSKVSGELPLDELIADKRVADRGGVAGHLVRFRMDVLHPGTFQLRCSKIAGLAMALDGKAVPLEPYTTLRVLRGIHTLTVQIPRSAQTGTLRIEVLDVPGSAAHVQLMHGM